MIKLKKAAAAEWLGNGMGNSTADWFVAKDPEIAIRKIGGNWYAIKDKVRIASGWDKPMLLESLERKHPELAA
jgi:hypothetical protein